MTAIPVKDNKDNIVTHIASASLGEGVAGKTGNPYTYVDLVWILPDDNTYTQRVFLNNESLPLVKMSVSNNTESLL